MVQGADDGFGEDVAFGIFLAFGIAELFGLGVALPPLGARLGSAPGPFAPAPVFGGGNGLACCANAGTASASDAAATDATERARIDFIAAPLRTREAFGEALLFIVDFDMFDLLVGFVDDLLIGFIDDLLIGFIDDIELGCVFRVDPDVCMLLPLAFVLPFVVDAPVWFVIPFVDGAIVAGGGGLACCATAGAAKASEAMTAHAVVVR